MLQREGMNMPGLTKKSISCTNGPLFCAVWLFLAAGLVAPIQAQTPVGHWTFEEGSGSEAADSSGNGHTATLANGVSWVGSPIGSGVAANGSARQFVSIPPINLSETRAVTISTWVNRTYSTSGGTVLFEAGHDDGASRTAFWLLPDDDTCHGIQAGLRGDVGSSSNCYAQPTSGVWHHLAVVLDKSQSAGSAVALYVDGLLQVPTWNVGAATNSNDFGNDPIYLFAREGVSAFSSGMIADLQVYDTALSDEQIQQIYRRTALMSLTVAPPSVSVSTGTQVQFTATGTYQDGSTRDLTNSAAWTAMDPSVGSISRGGMGIGAGTGKTTMIASLGRISGSAGLMVTTAASSTVPDTSLVGQSTGWQQGFDFRNTPNFVTDPSGSVYVLATTAYPTITNGVTYGWTNTSLVQAYDRSTTVDPRLAGTNVGTNSKAATFYVDVPSPGTYSIQMAMGDASYMACATQCQVQLLDGTTVLATISGGSIAAGHFYDANRNQWSSAQWPTNNQPRQVTLSGTRLTAVVGTNQLLVGSLGQTPLAYLGLTQVSGGGDFTLAASPTAVTVAQGNQGISTLTTTVSGGFNNAITLSASGVPSGATVGFSPNPIAAPGAGSSTMTIAVGSSTPIGTYALTVTGSGGGTQHNATLTLTVAPALVSIALTPANPSVPAGQPQQFTATGTYTDGSHQNLTTTAIWTSSAPSIATVSVGLATTLSAGSTTIQATSGSISGSTTLTVTAPALVSIALTPANPSVPAGQPQQFTATGTYTDGSHQNLTTTATWTSSAPSIATVSAGLATTLSAGSTTIQATSGSISGSTTLTVTAPALVSIALTPANPSVPAGQPQQFTATGTYTDGSHQNLTTTATWTSSAPSIATVSAGLATTLSAGSTTIQATSGSISGSTTLTVTAPALVSIALTPANPSVPAGQPQQFTATGTYTDGSHQNLTTTAIWTSSAPSIATVSAGLATTLSAGSTTIQATSGSICGSTTLTVTAPALVSIALTPANPSVPAGQPQQFTATGTYTDGSHQNLTTTAIWTSSAPSIATVSAGLATTLSAGSTTIQATSGSISGSTTLTVTAPALVSIALTPANPSVPAGQPQQFTATGTYTDGSHQNLTTTATWTSSAPSIATVSAGLATTLSAGSTTIQATSGSISGSTTLTVTAPALVSIALTPANPSVPAGQPQQFTATGTYTDGSHQNLTTTATWTSSAPSIATVSAGLATTLSAGSTTIQATSGSISGSTTLTVTAQMQHSVTLSWTASTSPGIAGYNAYRATVSGGPYTLLNSGLVANTTYSDQTVQSGLTYYYVTTAVDSQGVESVYSNEAAATVP